MLCQLSYAPTRRKRTNTPGRIRTCDPRIRSPMLYPAELRVQKKGWVMGLEPMASGTTIPRSYQLSYTHHVQGFSFRATLGTRRLIRGIDLCVKLFFQKKCIFFRCFQKLHWSDLMLHRHFPRKRRVFRLLHLSKTHA